MSLKHKFISTVALVFAVGAFGTFASAQDSTQGSDSTARPERVERGDRGSGRGDGRGDGMRGGKHDGGDQMMMRALEKLNLTDAQKTQVKTIFDNNRTQNQPQMDEMRALGMKKRDGVITPEEETRLKDLRNQMRTSGEQTQTSIMAILTPEQRAQLDNMREEMRDKMKERRQNRQNRSDQTMPPSDN